MITAIGSMDGAIKLYFIGAPGRAYQIERTSALGESASWEVVGSVTADNLGNGAFMDFNAPALQGFYRTKQYGASYPESQTSTQ